MAENGQKFSSGKVYIGNETNFDEYLKMFSDPESEIELEIDTDEQIKNIEKKSKNDSEKELIKLFNEQKELKEKEESKVPISDASLLDIKTRLEKEGYIATDIILYTIRNAMMLHMPILVEGEPGVGKTSLANALAKGYGLELIKIQFYEGISNNDILYEYDYPKQMLYMNAIRDNINMDLKGLDANSALKKLSENGIDFFDKNFLIERPLLKAISGDKQKVLLLDEVDKTSEETEYLLLEILSDYTITIPEYGTIKCNPNAIPIVFLTSNNYRELSDALKRRCLYLYIEPKNIDESKKIIAAKANVSNEFALKVAQKVEEIRKLNLKQKPSISDSINWALTLMNGMGIDVFNDEKALIASLGTILKNKTDIDLVKKAGIL